MAKNVSAAEKVERILRFFKYNTFFHMSELEKALPKLGISSMVIKDLLEQMVADSLISADKSGVRTFYYKKYINYKDELRKNTAILDGVRSKNEKVDEKIFELKSTFEGEKYRELQEIKKSKVANIQHLKSKMERKTYEEYREKERELNERRDKLVSITDTIFEVVQYLSTKMNIEQREIYKMLEIPDSFDY